jgi:hypothetical protein
MIESTFHTLFTTANVDPLERASCSIRIPYSQQELLTIEEEQHQLFEAHFREQAMHERIMGSRRQQLPETARALHPPAVDLPTAEILRPRPPSVSSAAVLVSPTSTTSDDIFWEYQQAWDNHHHHKQKMTCTPPTRQQLQPQPIVVVEMSDDDEGIFELEL